MKILNKFIWSKKEPSNKNDIWFDGSTWRMYTEEAWQSFTLPVDAADKVAKVIENASEVYQEKLNAGYGIIIEGNTISVDDSNVWEAIETLQQNKVEQIQLNDYVPLDRYSSTSQVLMDNISELASIKLDKADVATINGQSLIEGGNIVIEGGDSSHNIGSIDLFEQIIAQKQNHNLTLEDKEAILNGKVITTSVGETVVPTISINSIEGLGHMLMFHFNERLYSMCVMWNDDRCYINGFFSFSVHSKLYADSELSETSENSVQNKVVTEKLAELSEEIDSKLTENGIGEKSVTLAAGPTYTKAYFENPLPIGTKIKSISFNGVASWFYWVNGQGTLFTDAQISSASAPLTLDKEVYGVATPGDTATDVTIVYEAIVPTDKLARMAADITQLKEEVKKSAEAVGTMPEGKSVAEIVTETYEEIKTIEVDTPASYYGRVLFNEPILAGTLIKSIEIVGGVTWFYWANGIGSMFTDAQISAASAPMVLDKDVYGVAAPSSTSVHVKIVTSMGKKVIDKVARIDEDVQILKSDKKWEGKTIVAFGDSITHFVGSDNKTYSDHLAEITGANVINCGIGGSTYRQRATPEDSTTNENTARAALDIVNMVKAAITQNFTAQINAAALITTHQPYTLDYEVQVNNLVGVDWSKVDAVIFFGGTNDFANVGQLLGEDNSTSLSETKGALNYILTEFCKTYPKVKINFLTPIVRYVDPPQFSTSKQYNVGDVTMYQGGRYKFINAHSGAWNTADVQTITSYEARVDATWGDNYKNAGDMTLREYGEALGAFVKKVYHIVPIDMYNIGWNRVNYDNYFVNTDATHPLTGFKALAEVMAKKLDL